MTARAGWDWSPLGWSHDPVPGDPGQVRAGGTAFCQTADAADEAAKLLQRLNSGDGQCSDALDKLRKQASEAASDLRNVQLRYAGAGRALTTYAAALEQSQLQSLRALEVARPAHESQRHLDTQLRQVHTQALSCTEPQERQTLVSHLATLKTLRDTAAGHVAGARRMLQRAIDDRDSAAATAKQEIEGAARDSRLNDSWWDKTKEVLNKLQEGLGWASLALMAIGVVLIIVSPLTGGALAPIGCGLVKLGGVLSTVSSGIEAVLRISERDFTGAALAMAFAFGPTRVLKFLRLGKTATKLGLASRAVTFHRYGKQVFQYATKVALRRIASTKRAWTDATRVIRDAGRAVRDGRLQKAPGMLWQALNKAKKDYDRMVSKQVMQGENRAEVLSTVLDEGLSRFKDWMLDRYRNRESHPVVVRQGCGAR